MRTWLLVIGVTLASVSVAQEEKRLDIRQSPIQMLPQAQTSCSEGLKERGQTAFRSGNCTLAVQYFREAMQCPEVRRDEPLRQELERLLERCETKNQHSQPLRLSIDKSRQTEGAARGKGRYVPGRAFLENVDPNCFKLTKGEADRAFAGGFWEDAAALYRAAKSCTDADQNERQAMNDRIETCRLRAADELLGKEREAVRQARQAIAANRADDARTMLMTADRTAAFRMADFANEFIAPPGENNPDCQQVMFDAWYYDPASFTDRGEPFHVPFSYQVKENLGGNVEVRFAGTGRNARVFAFSPEQHLVYSWDIETLKPGRTLAVDTSFAHFDVFPDGRTFLFVSARGFTLWRSAYENCQINVWDNSRYALDKNGREFHYYDTQTQSLVTVRLDEVLAVTKGYYQQRTEATHTRVRGIDPGLLGFSIRYPEVWLAYPDSIVILHKNRPEASWSRKKVWHLREQVPQGLDFRAPQVLVSPENGTVAFFNDTAVWPLHLDHIEENAVSADRHFFGRMLAAGDAPLRLAQWEVDNRTSGSYLYVRELNGAQLQFRALCPSTDSYLGQTGAFSPDGNWFGLCTNTGTLKLWWLTQSHNAELNRMPVDAGVSLSPNARFTAVWQQDTIAIFDLNGAGRPLRTLQLPTNGAAEMVMGDQNLAFYFREDSIMVWNWTTGLLKVLPVYLENSFLSDVVTLDETHNWIALRLSADSVGVYDLATNRMVARKSFEGQVEKLSFLPGSGDLLIIPIVTAGLQVQSKLIPRLWSPGTKQADRRMLPLQETIVYNLLLTVSQDCSRIALCEDGASVQIFKTSDLRDEFIRIRPHGENFVAAMAFHPDGRTLAVGYMNGEVVFWDTQNGRVRFKFNPIFGGEDAQIRMLQLSGDGKMLRYLNYQNVVVGRLLEPQAIREQAQDANRQLVAFLPEQIRDFDLAAALEYPGNFEKLAMSGDLPLIRAFFDYYQQEAVSSNNIQRLSSYCERAFRLYAELDAPTREALRATMLEMYIDFHWKLLLRDNLEDAARVVEHIRRNFDNPLPGILAGAHTDLLQGNLRSAAAGYTDWVMQRAIQENYYDISELEALPLQFRQFAEYGLLEEQQEACICTLFGSVVDLEGVCPEPVQVSNLKAYLDARKATQWEIFIALYGADRIRRFSDKVATLQAARESAVRLALEDYSAQDELTYDVTLGLAATYAAWAVFEQTAPRAYTYYKTAIDLLEKGGGAQQTADTRLLRLTEYWMGLGTLYYKSGRMDTAWICYNKAKEAAELAKASGLAPDPETFDNDYIAPIRTQMGLTLLLQNKPGLAREQFRIANDAMTFGLNALYLGHADILENQREMAYIDYGGIFNNDQLGQALAFIDKMAMHIPERRGAFLGFRDTLSWSVISVKQLDSVAVQYYYALENIDVFAHQARWTDALYWSTRALEAAQTKLNTGVAGPGWADLWLDALLNQSYYQLFNSNLDSAAFSRSIRYVEQAERFVELQYPYYQYRHYFKTNLAHAYWLRGLPGDREAALNSYRVFMETAQDTWSSSVDADPWETLEKDFRDLIRAGVEWPEMEKLIGEIAPDVQLSPEDRKALGLPQTPNH